MSQKQRTRRKQRKYGQDFIQYIDQEPFFGGLQNDEIENSYQLVDLQVDEIGNSHQLVYALLEAQLLRSDAQATREPLDGITGSPASTSGSTAIDEMADTEVPGLDEAIEDDVQDLEDIGTSAHLTSD